jgi:carbon-monoxide dehydrogenase large subunit
VEVHRDSPLKRNAYIGAPVPRLEDFRFLTGRGIYAGDLYRDALLHAVIVRSPIAHGRLRRIDSATAKMMPGVLAVITARDIGTNIPRIPMRQEPMPELMLFEQPVISTDTVRYVGEPVAMVLAESAAAAEDAATAVVPDIEPLPVVLGAGDEALLFDRAGSNIAARIRAVRGDAAAAFENHRGYTRREKFFVHRHTAVALEPRCLLAEWDNVARQLTLYGAAKVPFTNRRILARFLGLPEQNVICIENDVGGAFGTRGEFYPEDFLIPFAARLTGRPVKWVEDRRENLLATNHAREAGCELEIACASDGRIVALRGEAFSDIGAYIRTVGVTPARNIAQVLSGPYRIPDIDISCSLQLSNKTPAGTYRGPGRFEADFFRERMLDIAADELGIDRVAFRRMNLIATHEMPYRLATVVPLGIESETDSGDYSATLESCLREFGWNEKEVLNGKNIDGRYHGIAVGCYLEGGASGPRETARLILESDGAISLFAGSSAVGQGLETALAQIAADALELPLSRIKAVCHGSTNHLAEGFGSYSSRSTVMGGSAVLVAAENLRGALRKAAAEYFGCDPVQIELIDGTARAPGHNPVDFAQLASGALSGEGVFASNKRTYSYGAHAAHVAVDPETGAVEVLDYVAIEDVGRIVNPKMLHGQTLGAIVQGLGGTLLEHLVYDDTGQLTTTTLADYLMPTACEFPHITVHATEDHPAPHNPLGAKGAGEGGIIPVGGVIANAIAAALKFSRVQPNALPLTPARLWTLLTASAAVSHSR